MALPKPGQRVRGSETGKPIMALLDLLGRRWFLRVGWELRGGPLPFRELQRRCGMPSPNVLTTRLREGAAAGLVVKDAAGLYALSTHGQTLLDVLEPLDRFAKDWARAERSPR